MKLLKSLVMSGVVFGFPCAAAHAQTVMQGDAQNYKYDYDTNAATETEGDTTTAYSERRHESKSNTYAVNDVPDASDEASDDQDSSNDKHNWYFDSGFKQLAYNTPEYRGGSSKSTFIFDPNQHRWYAYDRRGELVGSGRASGGKAYCPDIHRRCKTPSGSFNIYSMGGPGCISKKFPIGEGGAPMPYCMFFHGGYAVHGSYDVPNHNASHGCIRVTPDAARWLQKNVLQYGSRVIVRPY